MRTMPLQVPIRALAAGLAVAVVMLAWLPPGGAGAATQNVSVEDNTFVDGTSGTGTTTINVGDTVMWTWTGSNPHTVDSTSGGESFSSGAPQTSGTFSHTFNTPGTYDYICGVHGTSMQGTIVVNAGAAPTDTPVPQPTNTAPPQATNTPDADPTDTPVRPTSTSAPANATPSRTAVPPTVATTPSAGGAGGTASLPSAGTGVGDSGTPWLEIALAVAAVVAIATAGALAWARRRL